MLEQQKQKNQDKKKQHRLIPNESSADVIKKELQNVYKQIKNYEREINNLENKQSGGLITDKMSRLQNIYKEKLLHLQKLKNELSVLTKNSIENSRKLKNNAGKQQLENAMLKYNDQIKVLRQRARTYEERQKKKMQNAKKQFEHIKKLERELVENGVSMDQLEEMKRNNIYNQIYEKLNSDEKPSNEKKEKGKQQKIEETEDMSTDRYLELKNQIKLYKKLHLDYDKRLETLEKEREEQEKQMVGSKMKLQQKEEEIHKLQQQINELKTKMRKNTIKNNITNGDSKQKSKQKARIPTLKNKNSIQSQNTVQRQNSAQKQSSHGVSPPKF